MSQLFIQMQLKNGISPARIMAGVSGLKIKKRAIIYLLPGDKYFLVAFVFGAKATNEALTSDISTDIKTILESAKVYAEGRGFRIEVRNDSVLEDIKKLIDIKLKY